MLMCIKKIRAAIGTPAEGSHATQDWLPSGAAAAAGVAAAGVAGHEQVRRPAGGWGATVCHCCLHHGGHLQAHELQGQAHSVHM
jgi:hypothetical protein